MDIEVRTFQLNRNSWALSRAEDYLQKIKPFEKISLKMIKNEKNWLKGIDDSERVWICDERGESRSSREFAKDLQKLRDGGCRKLYVLLGGPFGFDDSTRNRGEKVILLSPFVLNQEVALTVLFEQVFRAYTIINNHPYHND